MSPGDRLRAAHLAFLALTAAWMGLAHPGGWLPALVVAVVAASGEALPRGTWREIAAPAVVLLAGAAGWAVGDGGRGAVHALLGSLGAALVLVPARPGALRLCAALAALELVVSGLPGVTGAPAWAAVLVLVPLATAALATDAWLGGWLDARHARPARWAALRWAVAPAAAAAVLGIAAFAPADRIAQEIRPRPVRDLGAGGGGTIDARQRSGERIGVEPGGPPPRDPAPAARLFLTRDPGRLVYLRLAACSLLQRDGGDGRWRWLPAPGERPLEPEPAPSGVDRAQLVRLGGMGDMVLAPDEGGWTSLDGLVADGDGNRWRQDLGLAIRSYEVALGGPARRESEADLAQTRGACRELPPAILTLPWPTVEDPGWRALPPEVAARRVAAALQARCAYDLEPPANTSDPLATFLFAADARDRRGTCEHFAGAAALLLRRAGHPARVVAGYASAEWDGAGIIFRRLHAHAWVEVLSEDGRWLRDDPTPAIAHANLPRPDADTPPPPEASAAVPLPEESPADRRHGWWRVAAAAGIAALAIVALVLRRRLRSAQADDPRRVRNARLRRRGDELVRLAVELGCKVGPADTVASICRQLTRRTGVDLGRELAAYEAARFGDGAEPPPWPIAALRSAARARHEARP